MMKPANEIRLVKENLDLSMALMQAVQDGKITAKQIIPDGPENMYIAFAVNTYEGDQLEFTRRAANQARAAFALSVIQTQRSLERVFTNAPIEEENPDLHAARCVMYLLYNTVYPNLFTPVWDCPPQYRRRFEVRSINLLMDATELHGTGLSWDHMGGLPLFLDLLEYFAAVIEGLPENEAPIAVAERPPVAETLSITPDTPNALVEQPEEILANPTPLQSENIDGPVARFIAERCELGNDLQTTAKELYAGFLEWCRETGQDDVSQRSFGMQLTAIGLYRRRRGRGKHWWEGIRLSGSMDEVAAKVAAGSLELTNGHREGYQPELAP